MNFILAFLEIDIGSLASRRARTGADYSAASGGNNGGGVIIILGHLSGCSAALGFLLLRRAAIWLLSASRVIL